MGGRQGGTIEYAPVGDVLYNGFDLGGARFYPWSTGLAITPPSYYGNYVGSADNAPVDPPAATLGSTTGGNPSGGGSSYGTSRALTNPFGKWSPVPWLVVGLIFAVFASYHLHYKG